MNYTLSPVIIFTYKRLNTLQQTIEALKKNDLATKTDLHIFSDGPKSNADYNRILEIRAFLKTIDGFKNIRIYESQINKGLANSIINGVSKIINEHGKVIVVEDDLKTTPNFLQYMNYHLNEYEPQKKVFSISGYSFNLDSNTDTADSYFLNRGWSWGWATWADRWNEIDWNVKDYIDFSKNKKSKRAFAKGGSDLNSMLAKQMTGVLDSWAIRWFYHQYKVQGLTLYPKFSKVYNNGFDSDATHTSGSASRYIPTLDIENKTTFIVPANVELDFYFQKQFQKKMGIKSRMISKIGTLIKKVIK